MGKAAHHPYASWARAYFDAYGDAEWERLTHSVAGKVNFALHRDVLRKHLTSGMSVLEAGAGPGRFTRELCEIPTRVTVGDISPKQLSLNAQYVNQNPDHASCIEDRVILDICDLSQFSDSSFDATVCIGGPLSYVFERADIALEELIRVTKPGGVLICSVMSRYGAMRVYLPQIAEAIRGNAALTEEYEEILATGKLMPQDPSSHGCQMYTWEQYSALFGRHACTVIDAAASNFLTASDEFQTHGSKDDKYAAHRSGLSQYLTPASLETIIGWERTVCRTPALLDGGTHIIAVARTPDR